MPRRVDFHVSQQRFAGRDEKHLCTAAEAVAIIKRQKAGCKFMIGASFELPTVDDNGVEDGKAFPGYGCLVVSKADMIKFVNDALRNLEKRGARIQIRIKDNFVHI